MPHGFKYVSAVLAVFLFLHSGCGRQGEVSRPGRTLDVARAAESPVVDGVLNDPCWESLEGEQFVLVRDGSEPQYPTTVRFTCDDEYLYAGFECQDPDAASTVRQSDGPVDAEDAVSLYIDANADSVDYFRLDIAPTGVMHDAFVLTGGDGNILVLSDWNFARPRISVSVYGGGASPGTSDRFWTVELAVPFAELFGLRAVPPQPGDMVRFNCIRHESGDGGWSAAVAPPGDREYTDPLTFIWLRFGGE